MFLKIRDYDDEEDKKKEMGREYVYSWLALLCAKPSSGHLDLMSNFEGELFEQYIQVIIYKFYGFVDVTIHSVIIQIWSFNNLSNTMQFIFFHVIRYNFIHSFLDICKLYYFID